MEDGKPTRAGWGSSRLVPVAPQTRMGAIKKKKGGGGGRNVYKNPPLGFGAAIRVPRIRELWEQGWRSVQ